MVVFGAIIVATMVYFCLFVIIIILLRYVLIERQPKVPMIEEVTQHETPKEEQKKKLKEKPAENHAEEWRLNVFEEEVATNNQIVREFELLQLYKNHCAIIELQRKINEWTREKQKNSELNAEKILSLVNCGILEVNKIYQIGDIKIRIVRIGYRSYCAIEVVQ